MWVDRLCHTGPENSGDEALARRLLGRGGPRLRANLRHDLRYAIRHASLRASPTSPNPRIPCGARTKAIECLRVDEGAGARRGPRGPTANRPAKAKAEAGPWPRGGPVPAAVRGDRRAVFHAVQRYPNRHALSCADLRHDRLGNLDQEERPRIRLGDRAERDRTHGPTGAEDFRESAANA